jgi:hypothetical protein
MTATRFSRRLTATALRARARQRRTGGLGCQQRLEKAKLPMIGNIDAYITQTVPSLTTGTRVTTGTLVNGASQNVTYASVKSTMTQSLICDGQVSKTYKAGEVFTITGVNAVNPRTKADLGYLKQFTIMADATSDGSGNVTLSICSGDHQLGRVPERVGRSGGQRGADAPRCALDHVPPERGVPQDGDQAGFGQAGHAVHGRGGLRHRPRYGHHRSLLALFGRRQRHAQPPLGCSSTARSAPIVASAPASAANRTGGGVLAYAGQRAPDWR